MQITDWINPQSEKNVGLPVDTVTFVQLFAQAGYRTGLFGKWPSTKKAFFLTWTIAVAECNFFMS